MSLLAVREISRRYAGQHRPAVADVSFTLAPGELIALVGASGSGKSTLLRLIAGLDRPEAGTIALDGEVISSSTFATPPERRGIGLVFQEHALFPHLSVAENIAFGLHRESRTAQVEKTRDLLALVGLPDHGRRYPHELSGGERQRIALARSLAPAPRLLLLDEPFSSLDTRLRREIREETRAILHRRNTAAIIVTHDVPDAFAIADRVVFLRAGEVQQIDTPAALYRAPANEYVASFFGLCNFLPTGVFANGADRRVGPPPGASGGAWLRPEDLTLAPASALRPGDLLGTVEHSAFVGDHLEVYLRSASPADGAALPVVVRAAASTLLREGEQWAIRLKSAEPDV